jgi:hypothetical protein
MHCGQIQQMIGVDIFISKKIDVDISFLALAITHWLVPLAYQLLSCTSQQYFFRTSNQLTLATNQSSDNFLSQ